MLTLRPWVEQHVEVCCLISLRALFSSIGYNSYISAIQTHNAVSSWCDAQLSLGVNGLHHTDAPITDLFIFTRGQAD